MRKVLENPTMARIEAAFPGFKRLWPQIKAACGTRQRAPKFVQFVDYPDNCSGNDYDCAKRFLVDLASGNILGERHVSCGEWAVGNGNADNPVNDLPPNAAVLNCTYNDYYRSFTMSVQVAAGTLVPELPAAVG